MTGRGGGTSRRRRGARGAIAVGGALVALLASGTQASAAPFANGSFETPAVGPGFVQRDAPYSFGDWQVTAGGVDHIHNSYWQAADGAQSIDLDGVT
jgi:hypothetical protein